MNTLTGQQFAERMEQIGEQVQSLSATAEPTAATAVDLVRSLVDLHGAGLARLLGLLRQAGEVAKPVLERFAKDDLVRTLLLVHGLHPVDQHTRLQQTVAKIRPVAQSYGGNVTISEWEPGRVCLRLEVGEGDHTSPATLLKQLLEDAILEAAPDVASVEFEDLSAAKNRLPQLPIITLSTPPARSEIRDMSLIQP